MGRRCRRERDIVDCCPPRPVNAVNVVDTCVVEINNNFYLIVELESNVPAVELDTVVSIQITREQYNNFIRCGVKRCTVAAEEPITGGRCPVAEFRCILIIDCQAFRVFTDTEGDIILVPTPICGGSACS